MLILMDILRTKFPDTDFSYYLDFCKRNNQKKKIKNKTELHHILPKSLFPEFSDLRLYPCNGVHLLFEHHYIAHSILAEITKDTKLISAWWSMNTNNTNNNSPEKIIGSEMYSTLKESAIANMSILKTNKVSALNKNTNNNCSVSVDEFRTNDDLIGVMKGKLSVLDRNTNEKILIRKEEYNKKLHHFHTTGKVSVIDKETMEWVVLDKQYYRENKEKYIHNIKGTVTVKDDLGNFFKITKKEFDSGNYKGVTKDTVSVVNILNNESLLVSKSEFIKNKMYIGVANTKFYIIDGVAMRSFDAENYIKSNGYNGTIHNFERKKNKEKFVRSFKKITKDEYISYMEGDI